ncbi:hypothetical protein J6590_089713 [Homalodisca vitripennis]|nr:hypothetical protein J6590_089713 [Homalodisca vitripennis]
MGGLPLVEYSPDLSPASQWRAALTLSRQTVQHDAVPLLPRLLLLLTPRSPPVVPVADLPPRIAPDLSRTPKLGLKFGVQCELGVQINCDSPAARSSGNHTFLEETP